MRAGCAGQGRSQICSDIFLVDGTTFDAVSLYPVERLERRIGHTAIELYNHIYVFGGWNSAKYVDYGCLLDIETEQLLLEENKSHKVPPARRDHTLTRFGRQMYLFGGWNCADQFSDVW